MVCLLMVKSSDETHMYIASSNEYLETLDLRPIATRLNKGFFHKKKSNEKRKHITDNGVRLYEREGSAMRGGGAMTVHR